MSGPDDPHASSSRPTSKSKDASSPNCKSGDRSANKSLDGRKKDAQKSTELSTARFPSICFIRLRLFSWKRYRFSPSLVKRYEGVISRNQSSSNRRNWPRNAMCLYHSNCCSFVAFVYLVTTAISLRLFRDRYATFLLFIVARWPTCISITILLGPVSHFGMHLLLQSQVQ